MKNDSWLFPFSMPNDSFFDSNRDGKLSGFESIMRDTYWLEVQRRWNEETGKSSSNSRPGYIPPASHSSHPHFDDMEDDEYAWRDDCEDGFEFDIYPEDYETQEEYEEALEAAKDEAEAETLDSIESDDEWFTDSTEAETDEDEFEDELESIEPENYPNNRRYEAAKAVAEKSWFSDYEKRACHFVCQSADTVFAANYLAYNYGFLYSQAIKDHFELPCTLPDEDEKPELELYQILVKIAKRDIPLSLKVWDWCMEQFAPYVEYDEFSVENLAKDVFDNVYLFSKREEFILSVIEYMEAKPDFGKAVMSLCKEYYDNVSLFIAIALLNEHFDTAKMLFQSALFKAKKDWKDVLLLTDEIILYCSDGKQLEAMEYFQQNFFPIIKAIPDGMVQDEIEEFEESINSYIEETESTVDKYAYSRKNAWRKSVPDGKEYDIDPCFYDSEEEYLKAYNEEKYGWRKRNEAVANEFGLDVNDFETNDAFNEVLFQKQIERIESERQAKFEKAQQKRKEEEQKREEALKEKREEALKDKSVYIYCGVLLPHSERPYSFRTEDTTINIGDTVVVPVGSANEETEGTVVSVGRYSRIGVPYPVEKTKMIIRKK